MYIHDKDSANNTLNINDDGSINVLQGLSIPDHDYVGLTYTGNNLTGVVYKSGGASGTIVASLTLTYTLARLDTVTKA